MKSTIESASTYFPGWFMVDSTQPEESQMHMQHTPGYMEADKMVEAFIARTDMAQAISEIKRAAAEGDDTFLSNVILRAYLGSTPIEE